MFIQFYFTSQRDILLTFGLCPYRVNSTEVQLGEHSLDHLYQPSGYSGSYGYKVVAPAYEHGNSTFFHTGSDSRGSFVVAPDWVSERKKAVVVRH